MGFFPLLSLTGLFFVALDAKRNNNKRKSSTGKTLSIEKYVGFNERLSTVNNVSIKVESIVIELSKIKEGISFVQTTSPSSDTSVEHFSLVCLAYTNSIENRCMAMPKNYRASPSLNR